MAKLSRSNIAYDLTISPHDLTVRYNGKFDLRYVFSSELYRDKFNEKKAEHREKINQSLTNRFGYQINADVLADLKLYATIEKRGFLLYKDGVKLDCQSIITLDGLMLTNKS